MYVPRHLQLILFPDTEMTAPLKQYSEAEIMIFLNARNSLLLSLFHCVSAILTQREHEITFCYLVFAPEVIRSFDTIIPLLLFSPRKDQLQGNTQP